MKTEKQIRQALKRAEKALSERPIRPGTNGLAQLSPVQSLIDERIQTLRWVLGDSK